MREGGEEKELIGRRISPDLLADKCYIYICDYCATKDLKNLLAKNIIIGKIFELTESAMVINFVMTAILLDYRGQLA